MKLMAGKWIVMSKKKKEIKFIIHIPDNIEKIFNTVQVKGFWIDRISAKIEAYQLEKDKQI